MYCILYNTENLYILIINLLVFFIIIQNKYTHRIVYSTISHSF